MSLARQLPRGNGPERLSKPPDPVDRRLHSRIGRRYYRARAGAAHGPNSRPAIRHRSQTGRRIKSCSRICRPRRDDGYTLFIASSANITNGAINPNLPFDMTKDFTPIALINTAAVILVVPPSMGVKNVQ